MLLPTTCEMIFILLEVKGEEKGLSFGQTIDLSFCGHPGTSDFFENAPSVGIRCNKVPLHIFNLNILPEMKRQQQ